ncbi:MULTISPECIES: ABC transporter permease [Frankia]|uniref:High-affinity D-ribose transport protein (ABC superfamily, membrane) n=1 Tax=Frankia alni (strain DSM 45986 / CECT 9034 / ACN14a) TaxID=326424 RepID=Q0RU61_FRAAA|nr:MULTISPECIES: ABC transporter permease [Frankia]MCM3920369.1 ABC transporter permease [Frankia sp. AiPs1]CAJ58883.1 high-affinity D-ribose transport protein (ABC superfamily, membrane) [Frankia alni ACN14a]
MSTTDTAATSEATRVTGRDSAGPTKRSGRIIPRLGLDRFSGLYVLAALIIAYGIWLPDTFLTSQTARSVADGQAIAAIVALALVVPLAAGVFDLSVAATLGFSVCLVAWLQGHHVNAILSVLTAVAAGIVIGAVNSLVIIVLRVNSFIGTLGMGSLLAAGSYWITDGQTLIKGFSPDLLKAGRAQPAGIPVTVWYLVGIALVLWFVLEYTPVGRYFYAVGANPQASRLAGLRVDRLVARSLILAGFLSALGGAILAAKLGLGSPDVGPPYLLPAFSAAFLGATQIKSGRVNVLGTLVAVYLLGVGVKGLQLAGAPSYVGDLFNGAALIIAVALAARTSRK